MWRVFRSHFLFVFSFLWGQRSGEQLWFSHLHSINICLYHNNSLTAFNSIFPLTNTAWLFWSLASFFKWYFWTSYHMHTHCHLLLGGYLCALEKQRSYSGGYTHTCTIQNVLMFTRCLLRPTVGTTASVCPSPTPCGGNESLLKKVGEGMQETLACTGKREKGISSKQEEWWWKSVGLFYRNTACLCSSVGKHFSFFVCLIGIYLHTFTYCKIYCILCIQYINIYYLQRLCPRLLVIFWAFPENGGRCTYCCLVKVQWPRSSVKRTVSAKNDNFVMFYPLLQICVYFLFWWTPKNIVL